jgi:2-iminobutanoate/2-iminopropanoate deaminase
MHYVNTAEAPAAIGPYSQAISHGSCVFLSGQIPLDPGTGELVEGDIRAQTRRVLENLRAVLAASGCDKSHVMKTTIYLLDMADFQQVNEEYAAFFGAHRPARATVAVAGLPKGARVEIDAICITGQ